MEARLFFHTPSAPHQDCGGAHHRRPPHDPDRAAGGGRGEGGGREGGRRSFFRSSHPNLASLPLLLFMQAMPSSGPAPAAVVEADHVESLHPFVATTSDQISFAAGEKVSSFVAPTPQFGTLIRHVVHRRTPLNCTAAALPPHDHSIALTNWHRCDLHVLGASAQACKSLASPPWCIRGLSPLALALPVASAPVYPTHL
jgi:hypothetical protein